ncbi:MAG: nitroreductase family protein, partial [Proteobacteria bacterium]|nr:nitroreductase family protein [Pseudomonadota bacterium]
TNIDSDSFINFLANRRSIRNFKDKEVPKEILQRIIDATSFAPYGVSPKNLMITIVQNKEILEKALLLIVNTDLILYQFHRFNSIPFRPVI